MRTLQVVFFILLFIPFYAYIGYGILLALLVRLKRWRKKTKAHPPVAEWPAVTLLIPAYNELQQIAGKIQNTRALDYPREKFTVLWVTDGSDDGSDALLKSYDDVQLLHQPGRQGKVNAMNRAMKEVTTPLVIFSDANTMLNCDSIKRIVHLFRYADIACVSGEKRIQQKVRNNASTAGEGLYWQYESLLKKWDAELYSVVGAAGELFAVRTALYPYIPDDTLLDDFVISLRIAMLGYRIGYEPTAYALETGSENIQEELKRKIRISAGGLQAIVRLSPLLNIFKYGILSFQYISHRVLRWTLAPLSLPLLLVMNLWLSWQQGGMYSLLMLIQVAFYLFALIGWLLEARHIRRKLLFVPYYFFMMNLAVLMGFYRLLTKKQNVLWDKAVRARQD